MLLFLLGFLKGGLNPGLNVDPMGTLRLSRLGPE